MRNVWDLTKVSDSTWRNANQYVTESGIVTGLEVGTHRRPIHHRETDRLITGGQTDPPSSRFKLPLWWRHSGDGLPASLQYCERMGTGALNEGRGRDGWLWKLLYANQGCSSQGFEGLIIKTKHGLWTWCGELYLYHNWPVRNMRNAIWSWYWWTAENCWI